MCSNPNAEVLRLLLAAGASVNDADSSGMTALMWAARENPNPKIVTLLLGAGANGKTVNFNGKTAFDCAGDNGKLKGTSACWALNNAAY
jgi:ankyrin repeat protein